MSGGNCVSTLKFNKFELEILDFIKLEDQLAFDLQVNIKLLTTELIPFFNHHWASERHSMEFQIDDKEFDGYLGNYAYDKNGNLRLWVFKEFLEVDPNTLTQMVVTKKSLEFYNLKKVVKNHELKYQKLLDLLLLKKVISDDEAKQLGTDYFYDENNIDLKHEVNDLFEYLNDTSKTLSDIKNEE